MPETRATLRHSGTAPNKVRQVLNLIRGLDVSEAREVLRFCERGAAEEVAKLLDSAVANAEHNDSLPADELYVTRAWADEGPTAKRYRPRARGRGTRIRKRTSHVTIVVARYSDDQLRQRATREAASGVGAAAERRRRLTRRRRVAASTPVEHDHDHDHDEDGHTHEELAELDTPTEDALDDTATDEVGEASDEVGEESDEVGEASDEVGEASSEEEK